MPVSKGRVEGRLQVLKPREVGTIHRSALRVLSQVGIELRDQELRKLLVAKGAKAVGHRVYIPEPLVQEALEMVPHEFTLYARGNAPTLDLGPGQVYLGTGGAALWILDPETDQVREATLRDLADLAWLVDNLEHVHFFLRPVIAHDVPKELLDVNTLYACLANTQKHAQSTAVIVSIVAYQDRLLVSIQDNGTGFPGNARAKMQSDLHFGMRTMHQLAEQAGGYLETMNNEDGGAVVRLTLPLSAGSMPV